MNFLTAVYTNPGGRSNNEDNAGYYLSDDQSHGIWIVADGLGGHQDGEIASGLAVDTGIQAFQSNSDINPSNVSALFQSVNETILAEQSDHFGMKTTMVALLISENQAMWGHVGDSRLYYFSGNRVKGMTKDHSVSQIAVNMGEITPDQIRGHVDRSKLLRALGDREDIRAEVTTAPTALKKGDAFLLCTDGFWEFIYEMEMEIDLVKSETPERWLRLMSARLYDRAPENNDNNTAVAVFIR